MSESTTTTTEMTEAEIETALAAERKAKFAKAINPKVSTLMQKRDEIVNMAKNPKLYQGALDNFPNPEDETEMVNPLETLLATVREIEMDIEEALKKIGSYEPEDATPRSLREKPKFNLFG